MAVLEILVNFSVLPRNYVLTRIEIPDGIAIEYVSDVQLPANWDAPTPSLETQEFGALWVEESRSPILSVPSSILRTERNYVINPAHRDFDLIRFYPPQRFRFDPRLK